MRSRRIIRYARDGVVAEGARSPASMTGSSRRPVRWAPAVGCTLITTMLAVVSCVVQPALFFVGDAAAYYPVGVGACLLSTAIVAVVVALTSRYAGAVAKSQEESAVVLALIVQAIMPALAARGAGDEILPTLLAAIAVASVATGLACILLGLLRGGDLVRFLPFPVIAGFLAGVGWLLVGGAISASGVPVEAGGPASAPARRRLAALAAGAGAGRRAAVAPAREQPLPQHARGAQPRGHGVLAGGRGSGHRSGGAARWRLAARTLSLGQPAGAVAASAPASIMSPGACSPSSCRSSPRWSSCRS